MKASQPLDDRNDVSLPGCLLRVFWMGLGNAALAMAAVHAARGRDAATANLIFACVVASLIAARAFDVLRYSGTTTQGRPATRADLRGYVVRLLIVSAVLWFAAQSVRGPVG